MVHLKTEYQLRNRLDDIFHHPKCGVNLNSVQLRELPFYLDHMEQKHILYYQNIVVLLLYHQLQRVLQEIVHARAQTRVLWLEQLQLAL